VVKSTKNHFAMAAGKIGLRSRVFTFAQNNFYKIYEAATAGNFENPGLITLRIFRIDFTLW
jgi:hypothetical protein